MGMSAGDGAKRNGRADQAQQLAGRATSPRARLLPRSMLSVPFSPLWFGTCSSLTALASAQAE